MKNIYIFSGPIHSGKTSKLMHWAAKQRNIDGIFQPVIDEKRFIYHIATKTLQPLETDKLENIIQIGKYKFSNKTFNWAKNVLLEASLKKIDWLVIDEIGPLELNGKALEPVVTKLITYYKDLDVKLLCVVREEMLDQFINHYQIANTYQLFSELDLNDS